MFGAKATDADELDNRRITYLLSGENAASFKLHPETGVLKAAETLSSSGTYRVRITGRDSGSEPKEASVNLTVKVAPANLFPVIQSLGESKLLLSEDGPPGQVIAKVSATSPKRGPAGTIRYAIAGGSVGDALRMNPLTGEVLVAGGLDYETSPQYEVWVEASDSDVPPLRSVLYLSINVTDANDNAPVMDNALYNATIPEEEVPPLRVVSVKATDADSGLNGKVTYRLKDTMDGAFSIDENDGTIYTETKLDRETMPSYELTVEALDHGSPQLTGSATVIVTLQDKNDNPPIFTRLFSVNVTENSEIGSFVIRVTTSDLDIGENANATYSFRENPGENFDIDPISGIVTVAKPLDREVQDEYLLKVAASESGWEQVTPLTITIQDVNDNAPEFDHSYYSFNFPELQRPDTVLGKVMATDRDKQGPNSVISYSLKHPSDLFTVDPATGELISKRSMRYKYTSRESSPENQYPLVILATDNGKPPMSSECLVTVNVVDANNNPPKFERGSYFSPVPESASVGDEIIKVKAEDTADFGVNAQVEYEVVDGNGTALFTVDKNSGWISLSHPLNESGRLLKHFILNVRAFDKGVPPLHDDTRVVLIITGENKFSPVFKAPTSQVFIHENEPVGATILKVVAQDGDVGPNGEVRYFISGGNADGAFDVNATTGVINIMRPLDYETVREYHFNVTATDLGFEPKQAVAMVTVILTDINDNPPRFNRTSYEAYIPENSPINTSVFRAEAHDIDSPKNAIIRYSIVGGSGAEFFNIDPKSGIITSKVVFDYEEKTLYTLNILASNPDSTMYGSARVDVHITGVNEYYPRFVQPVFHLDVSESAEVGTSVGVIQATDQDAGNDSDVFYLLVGSSNDRGFSVGSRTGVVSVSRSLDRETQNRVVLTVMAKNAGSIRGNDTDEAQVIISVQDGNDPPQFLRSEYDATVSEGTSPGTHVVTVRAIDKDVRTQNNQFSYSILSGNEQNVFKVDPQTGDIETNVPLDREAVSEYTLTVGAIDTGTPPATGTTTVHVVVGDVNDNPPALDEPLTGYVSENEPRGTIVMTLSATDPDLSPNGAPFTYALVGGRHRDFFSVEKRTGVMKTTQPIDREATPLLEAIVSNTFFLLNR